jgi:hypothetical protein
MISYLGSTYISQTRYGSCHNQTLRILDLWILLGTLGGLKRVRLASKSAGSCLPSQRHDPFDEHVLQVHYIAHPTKPENLTRGKGGAQGSGVGLVTDHEHLVKR